MSRVRKTVVKKWLLGRAYGFLVFQGVGIPPPSIGALVTYGVVTC
jgi:hypothetical protein